MLRHKDLLRAAIITGLNEDNSLNIKYLLDKEILEDKQSRLYFIIVNDEIKKIGGSADKQGIKGTINNYRKPDKTRRNRFALKPKIIKQLEYGYTVEVWVLFLEKAKVNLLFPDGTYKEIETPVDFKYLENEWIIEYEKQFGFKPEWNIEERGEKLDGTSRKKKNTGSC